MGTKEAKVRRTFRLSVRIKGCSTVFKKGFAPGVVSTLDVAYVATPKEFKGPRFLGKIIDHQDELIRDTVEVDVEELSSGIDKG